jgi:hypothetical protein
VTNDSEYAEGPTATGTWCCCCCCCCCAHRDKLRGLPLAPGCVSLYIRHGDKHTEHKTYNDSEYEQALNQLRRVDPSLTRQVFLSTEDPATVTYYTNATRRWSTSYVEMPRKPDRWVMDAACQRNAFEGWGTPGGGGMGGHCYIKTQLLKGRLTVATNRRAGGWRPV